MRKRLRSMVIMAIASMMLLGSTMTFAADEPNMAAQGAIPLMYGDFDRDYVVDALDFAQLKFFILEGEGLTRDSFKVYVLNGGRLPLDSFTAADVNGDQVLSSLDLVLLKQYLLGVIDIFPVENQGTWIPCIPSKENIQFHIEQNSAGAYQVVFEVTFPSSGYKVEYTDELAVAAVVNPDGTTLISYRPVVQPKFWQYTGPSLTVMTTKRLAYTIAGKGDYTFEFLGTWYNFTVK